MGAVPAGPRPEFRVRPVAPRRWRSDRHAPFATAAGRAGRVFRASGARLSSFHISKYGRGRNPLITLEPPAWASSSMRYKVVAGSHLQWGRLLTDSSGTEPCRAAGPGRGEQAEASLSALCEHPSWRRRLVESMNRRTASGATYRSSFRGEPSGPSGGFALPRCHQRPETGASTARAW